MNIGASWTDERISELKIMWRDGLSASQIGAEMNVTRNSIIGKVHRLGLGGQRNHGTSNLPRPPRPPKPKLIRTAAPSSPRPDLGIEPDHIVDLPPDQSEFACTIVKLKPNMCRFPLGKPAANMKYCGAETAVGSWCARHYRITHIQRPRR